MKKFSYRFEAMLNYREHRVEEARLALAEAQQDLQKQEKHLSRLEQEKADMRREVGNYLRQGDHDGIWLAQQGQRYLAKLEKQLTLQRSITEQARVVYAKRQEALRLADQEKSILEEHKDHRHQAWARDLRKWEMDQLDEAAGSRFYQQTRAAQAESGENDL